MKTEVIPARSEHCPMLAANMDEDGREFIRKYYEVEAEQGLSDALAASTLCWTILIDGEAAGMFGCTERGQVWLTTAPAIERAKLRFIRQSRSYLAQMLGQCGGSLYATVHKGNKLLMGWLMWSGFEIKGEVGDFWLCVFQSR